MKYILDTDHISILQQGGGPDFAILSLRLAEVGEAEVVVSIISFHEQLLGAHSFIAQAKTRDRLVRGYEMLQRIANSYPRFEILGYNPRATQIFEDLRSAGVRIPTMDLRIAAIVLAEGGILLTRNRSDFDRVPSIRTEDWTA